jgi:hypothetical protein
MGIKFLCAPLLRKAPDSLGHLKPEKKKKERNFVGAYQDDSCREVKKDLSSVQHPPRKSRCIRMTNFFMFSFIVIEQFA